jgi:hypothetical protein
LRPGFGVRRYRLREVGAELMNVARKAARLSGFRSACPLCFPLSWISNSETKCNDNPSIKLSRLRHRDAATFGLSTEIQAADQELLYAAEDATRFSSALFLIWELCEDRICAQWANLLWRAVDLNKGIASPTRSPVVALENW